MTREPGDLPPPSSAPGRDQPAVRGAAPANRVYAVPPRRHVHVSFQEEKHGFISASSYFRSLGPSRLGHSEPASENSAPGVGAPASPPFARSTIRLPNWSRSAGAFGAG